MADSAGYSSLNGDAGVVFSWSWINCDAAIASAYSGEVLGM